MERTIRRNRGYYTSDTMHRLIQAFTSHVRGGSERYKQSDIIEEMLLAYFVGQGPRWDRIAITDRLREEFPGEYAELIDRANALKG